MNESLTPETPVINPPEVVSDPLKDIKAKLTDKEKESFFKAFLSDQPYTAEETLFNGKIHVKFESLSIKANNTIMTQIQFDRDHGEAKNTDAYVMRVIQYRVAASLIELDHKPFAKDITEETIPTDTAKGTTYLIGRLALMSNWPVFKLGALTDAFNKFERKLRALTEESFKENF